MPLSRFGSIDVTKEIIRPYYLKWLYFPLLKSSPSYFKTCWEFPSAHPPDESRQERGLPDIIFTPMVDWHTRIQRTQQLALAFAEAGHRCFYLNPHLGREFAVPYPLSPRHSVQRITSRIFELHVHLWREPVFHQRLLLQSEQQQVALALNRVLDDFQSDSQFIISSFPLWNEIIFSLRRDRRGTVIYDCHDLLTGFHNISPDIQRREIDLLHSCDGVAFSSDWLQEHIEDAVPHIKGKTQVIPNAVNFADFASVAPHGKTRGRSDGSVCVGYVGSMQHWVDVDSLLHLATERPQWRLVLVGRIEHESITRLASLPNVELTGEIPYEELPELLSTFDVALIPFLVTPLTLATNPVKLYEYFACGLPVVSAALPEVQKYGDLAGTYEGGADLVAKIESALREDGPQNRLRRQRKAQEESWRSRRDQFIRWAPASGN